MKIVKIANETIHLSMKMIECTVIASYFYNSE